MSVNIGFFNHRLTKPQPAARFAGFQKTNITVNSYIEIF